MDKKEIKGIEQAEHSHRRQYGREHQLSCHRYWSLSYGLNVYLYPGSVFV